MNHLEIKDNDVPAWPIGSSIIVKFPYDGGDSHFDSRAAMLAITPELKEAIEQAAQTLKINNALRTVQFYWPIEVITNAIFGQPIPKQFSGAIVEMLNTEFDQAIADETTRDAIRRISDLDATTWVSVERPFFGIGGGTVIVGRTIMEVFNFSTAVKALTTNTKIPCFNRTEDHSRILERAVGDLCELGSKIEARPS